MTNPHPVQLGGIHHAAYRCKDAKETVEWYGRVLGMDYTTAFAEDHVPSTGEYDPYMHVFLDAGNGNVLAFFELPNQTGMGRDENTPAWVQHLAFKVANRDAGRDTAVRVTVDAAGYRERREQMLHRQADQAAARAARSGRPVALDAMSATERKVVHEHLKDRDDVETYSEGTEPDRHLVVAPLR